MAYIDQDRSREKMVSGAISVAIVGVVGFGLVSGLALQVIRAPLPDPILHNWRHTEPVTPRPKPIEHKTQPSSKTTTDPQPQTRPHPDTTIDLGEKATPVDIGGGTGSKIVDPPPPPPPPVADHSARATPRGSTGDWVTTDDYPPSAVRSGIEGRTSFRLDIGADGRPTGCTVLGSSGSGDLDRTACRKLMSRARFRPALDMAGNHTASTYEGGVTWKLPAE
ncbi:energy transducer TonB [Sphingomonas sp. CGMCC 1.13654]|uniref:Energy transducer TonB n=1 Tax=Sphingomonas chungangi TaxID=2683589 RepID=A0A838L5T2_9SPHN|nr:energy transducer TonB [Sphingomonas chungangi]MBA2934853.1 energy transducer TonB [Sphingomonas chungangi]MVW58164.1 TonB family protein [Sphingomonas chungangi]